jgi:hypothetical protein
VVDGGDGAALFIGWTDTQLAAPCSYRLATDNELRCLPDATSAILYSDPTCAVPIVRADAAVTVVSIYDSSVSCEEAGGPSPPTTVVRVGVPVNVPMIYFKTATGCTSSPNAESGWRSATIASPNDFVRADAKSIGDDGILAARVYSGEDGSIETPAFYDAPLATTCVLAAAPGGGPLVCLPKTLATQHGSVHADGACATQPLAVVSSSCPPPAVIASIVRDPCDAFGSVVTAYARGLAVPAPAMLFQSTDGHCDLLGSGMDSSVFARGAPLDWGSLPALATIDVGKGRLKARFGIHRGAVAHNPFLPPWVSTLAVGFVDSVLAEPCVETLVSDGTERCLPPAARLDITYYADAACTQPLLFVPTSNCVIGPAPRFVVTPPVDYTANGPTPVRSLYKNAFAAPATPGAYVISGKGGGCVWNPPPAPAALSVLTPLDVATFPTLTTRIE